MKALLAILLSATVLWQTTVLAQSNDACASEREQGGLALQICRRKALRSAQKRNIAALSEEIDLRIRIIREEFARQEDVLKLAEDERSLSYKFAIEDVKRRINELRRFGASKQELTLLTLYQDDLRTEQSIIRELYKRERAVLREERDLQVAKREFEKARNAATIIGTGRVHGQSVAGVY